MRRYCGAETILWGEEILRSGRVLRMQAEGVSMLPWIWPGDTLQIQPLGSREPVLGDTVVFRRAQSLVAHRLVEKGTEGDRRRLVTKGDFLELPDSTIDQTEVLGIVNAIERRGRVVNPRSFGRRAIALMLWPMPRRLQRLGISCLGSLRRMRRQSPDHRGVRTATGRSGEANQAPTVSVPCRKD